MRVPDQVAGNGAESEGGLEREEEGIGRLGRGRITGYGMDMGEEESRNLLVWKF